MPDPRDPHADTRLAERIRAYDDAMAEHRTPAHLDHAAIANCQLCDEYGYRNGNICDHEDHGPAAKRGIAACRAALAKSRKAD